MALDEDQDRVWCRIREEGWIMKNMVFGWWISGEIWIREEGWIRIKMNIEE